jgi:hypothetical protein
VQCSGYFKVDSRRDIFHDRGLVSSIITRFVPFHQNNGKLMVSGVGAATLVQEVDALVWFPILRAHRGSSLSQEPRESADERA